ncbi:MAG: hypothetical protein HGA84_02335, partial [Syntrophobacteraceae bacterium]|nr:hypothetical protein [Syntrophobacteraceae bacterium]
LMPAPTANAIPEQGQIVTVRQRQYVVTDVLPSALPPPQPGSLAEPQHLVTLNSVEDDSLGDELQVIWRGNVRHFLFPLHSDYHNPNHFQHAVGNASTLKALFEAIESETNKQFDIISIHYVLYLPESFLGPLAR